MVESPNYCAPYTLCYCWRCHQPSNKLDQGSLLAKVDIKSAFSLPPVHPSDRYLLQMACYDSIYVDTCLPFGMRFAPFNVAADLLQWGMQQQGVPYIFIHYLDDFLTFGHPSSAECQDNLDIHLFLPCSPSSSRKNCRMFNNINLLRNHYRLNQNGNKTARW